MTDTPTAPASPAPADVDLDELERLHKAATPVPWTDKKPDTTEDGWSAGIIVAAVARGQCVYADSPGGSFPAADQALIAAMRNVLPALLAELRAARAVVEAAREYDAERDNPAPDYTMRRLLREKVKRAITAYDAALLPDAAKADAEVT